ncbi:MAG: response regulator [Epsilonproteobacteria bacterium]|nr:response regulator [Campylobacterota bacterium]
MSTYLASNFKQRNTEVVFNIHENVPRYLTGDVIHFSRIINNILEFAIQSTPQGKVTLEITCDKPLSNDIILNVMIKDSAKGLGEDTFKKLFELNYNDKKKEQWGFGLYIAKKLTLAIGGTIEAHSAVASDNVFSLQIPMQLNEDSTLKEFNVLKEGLAPRKILIYSEKAATGNSLKKLFNYFYEEVELATRIQLDKRLINLLDFDIIVLEDIFFNTSNNAYLKSIKESKDVYIVGLSSIFSSNAHEDNVLIDSYLKTPSNLERIVTLIHSLDTSKPEVEAIEEEIVHEEKNDGKLLVYKEPIKESQNIDLDCFTYFKGSRLLIVEDNLINQKIIVSVLKKSGIEIEIANNGQEALDILFVEQKMFDIVLMDISMPVMDGLIATQHIRERKAYDKMPIITFTAFAMGSEIEQMFDAGCNAYLTKPLNIKKLYHAFSMFLSPSHREVSLHKTIEIEGLDIEVGIYNADESEVLYKETLKEFILVYKDMSESIPKWINEKRYERVKLACNESIGE